MKKALSLLLFLIVITAACCALGETAEAPAPARADHLDISAFEKKPSVQRRTGVLLSSASTSPPPAGLFPRRMIPRSITACCFRAFLC